MRTGYSDGERLCLIINTTFVRSNIEEGTFGFLLYSGCDRMNVPQQPVSFTPF